MPDSVAGSRYSNDLALTKTVMGLQGPRGKRQPPGQMLGRGSKRLRKRTQIDK